MKKTIITIGLISAVGIGEILAGYKLNSSTTANANTNSYGGVQSPGINNNNNNTGSTDNNAGSNNNSYQNSMGANPPSYIYKDGKLKEYSEDKENNGGDVIATDEFNLGDEIDIKVNKSL